MLSQLSASIYRRLFLGLARKRPPRAHPIHLGANSRILAFSCAGIGDTLTDSVVFKALRETYPTAHIAGVVHRRRALLLQHNPCVDQIFLFHKGPLAFLRLRRELRTAGPWDAILQLRGNDPEPRCLSYAVNPDVSVSVPNMTHLEELCGHHVAQPDWDATHGVEQTLRIARYVGADTTEPHLIYAVRGDEKACLEEKLLSAGIRTNKPRLILQIGGGRRAAWRDWPMRRYGELLRRLPWELEASIFVLGGEDQRERAHELRRCCSGRPKSYHDLVGRLSLTESAALLSSARALVSTDTGIMHLGFAVGTRVVALIHCNNPASRVGPYGYGARHRVVQLARPANYRTPADADMANISVPQVLTAVQEVWGA